MSANVTSGYLRSPDILADLITFTAADDVWLAPVTGGRAWRLTSDNVPVRTPRFSPDGSRIAWATSKDSGFEVHVTDLDGGSARRLTYFGSASTSLLGWYDDESVIVSSAARTHERFVTFAYRVGLDGAVTELPYGPVAGVARGDAGLVVSSKAIRNVADQKRYRGGTASKLWWDPSGAGESYQRVLGDVTAGLESPVWVGNELIFTSDLLAEIPGPADEQANLFSISADRLGSATAADLTRRTFHIIDQGYVQEPVTDGTRIAYHARGILYLIDELGAEPRPLEISLPLITARRTRSLSPTENLTSVIPDRTANGSVVSWRGKAFYLSHREGPARALVADSSVRIREPRPLGRTGKAIMVSDRTGVDRVEIHPLDGQGDPQTIDIDLGRILHVASDPAGERVCLIGHDGRISLLGVADGNVRSLGVSADGEAKDPVFSPDGRYLTWTQPVGSSHSQLIAVDLAQHSEPVPLTSGRFADSSPAFTADGKYLAFLSLRTFDPHYDSHVFDMSFPYGTRPYLVPLAATEPPPFGPSLDGWPVAADQGTKDQDQPDQGDQGSGDQDSGDQDRGDQDRRDQKKDDRKKADKPPASPDLDVDGFEDRLVPFPVPAGDYRSLQAAKGGVLWIREAPTHGVLGTARAGVPGEKPSDQLERFDFGKRSIETLAGKIDSYAVSGDLSWIVARDGDSVTVRPADREVKDDDPARVDVDLSRLRFELDPVAEWHQMLDEHVRLMRDHYWRADLDGVDLEAVADHYRPVIDRLGSYDDLISLLWEVGAEMNTSHAYARAVKPYGDTSRALGLLGADFSKDGDEWVIDLILPGESSDPDARSPLRAAGVDAQPGDRIIRIGGLPVDPVLGPNASLIGAADKPIELVLRRPGRADDRRVVVVPVGDESALRYHTWVAGRKAYVAEHSGGRLGYVHVPDMVATGWAQLHRDLEEATRHEGVIADVRFNGGGHLSQLVNERLGRKVIAWDVARHGATTEYPSQGVRGPVVYVANEYAGSDGDIVNASARALGIGPIVGTRTWGGVVGIDGRFDLIDGTGVTQPRYAYWIEGQGWDVENHGVDPDIEVPITPDQWHGEADPQLDRAIAEALQRLEQTPAATPPQSAPPRVRR
jgi:tricorn protease